MKHLTDEQLISHFRDANDQAALEELVQRYIGPLYSTARRFTGNSETAADIVQESFVKIWKNIDRFDTTKQFRSWAFTITTNTALDWLKSKQDVPFSSLETPDTNEWFADNI